MALHANLNPSLQWRRPAVARPAIRDGRSIVEASNWQDFEVTPRLAEEAFSNLVAAQSDAQACAAFVAQFGPLTAAVGDEISVADWVRAREPLLAVHDAMRLPADDPFAAAVASERAAVSKGKRGPDSLVATHAMTTARAMLPFMMAAQATLRLGFDLHAPPDDTVALIAGPTDLLGALWIIAAARIMFTGEYVGRCRNKACDKPVTRNPHDGNDMRRLYHDGEKSECAVHVMRHSKDDRYPSLRSLKGPKLKAEIRNVVSRNLGRPIGLSDD